MTELVCSCEAKRGHELDINDKVEVAKAYFHKDLGAPNKCTQALDGPLPARKG